MHYSEVVRVLYSEMRHLTASRPFTLLFWLQNCERWHWSVN